MGSIESNLRGERNERSPRRVPLCIIARSRVVTVIGDGNVISAKNCVPMKAGGNNLEDEVTLSRKNSRYLCNEKEWRELPCARAREVIEVVSRLQFRFTARDTWLIRKTPDTLE